ncbi:dipeptide ABC transporter ATP-binding protein [Ruicaihuangia caeni]|uniref:ABC transporter ATP-binding protein n=1 Tax=Ruicaihuangia caeni TaxID=3042517 RepID=A0AAW6TB24_9MICO|nr:ABC transporter ATP-binding protein [Klugiella sp. YN-L-19]MDI2099649.1 ABC transporter ATP-binding protein [Klugiella sp. YN-L-19]
MNATAVTSDTPILEVRDLDVEFWVDGQWIPAAEDITYTLNPGEVLAIVGESGSGKSTSSMALLGLLPDNGRASGSVKLEGEELIGAPAPRLRKIRGDKIAVIFQEPMTALNPVYRVGYQIVEALQTHNPGMTKAQARTRALELLGLVEMPDPQKAYDSYPHQLSGGQRQRAMIAQSISCDPTLLVADEPTTALDVTVQAEILDLLRNLHRRLNSAIILITHDMGVVADLADRVIVMKDGKTVERGDIVEVFRNPQHPYTQQLLASVPHLGQGAIGASAGAGTAEALTAPGTGAATAAGMAVSVEEVSGGAAAPAQVSELGDAPVLEAARRRPEPFLVAQNISIEYPKLGRVPAFRAVDDVSFEMRPREVLGVVGESGSGKTTIGRALVGLLPIVEGTLTIGGQSMTGATAKQLRAVRRSIGIVFQDPGSSLNPRFPIGESIAEPLLLSGEFSRAQMSARVEELLDQVELPRSFRNRYPHELSGGQRQRVGIARGLALHPALLVADEPTSALDVSVQARVLELLQELQQELGFACLFISHDLGVVDLLADRILVMHRGKIVEQGTKDQILRSPREDYTRRLISAVPLPDPIEQRKRREERAAG